MEKIIKKKIRLVVMLIWQIVIPIGFISIPLFCSESMLELIVSLYETIAGKTCTLNMNTDIAFKIIVSIGFFMIIYCWNRKMEKEFLYGNVYGSKYMIWYYLSVILGYKKISLIRKPYNVIFKILDKKLFDEIIPDGIETDEIVNAYIDFSNMSNSKNLRECNLIISDTYKIENEQIPENKRNLDTICVYRDKSNKVNNRVYSPKLLTKIGEAFEKAQDSGGIINLYLTTNTKTTKEMIEKILMKGQRSAYNIRLFLQEDNEKRIFGKRGISIKM